MINKLEGELDRLYNICDMAKWFENCSISIESERSGLELVDMSTATHIYTFDPSQVKRMIHALEKARGALEYNKDIYGSAIAEAALDEMEKLIVDKESK